MVKRTNPSVPPNQIDKVVVNAKKLESIRPAIMDEVKKISSNPNVLNPDGLHAFFDSAYKGKDKLGWRYELDTLNVRLREGSRVEFSRKVLMNDGVSKEVDILDYTRSELVEIKSYTSKNFVSVGKKFGEDVGQQIGTISDSVKSQFVDRVGQVRIEPGANDKWYYADKETLISSLNEVREKFPAVRSGMDNMTKLIIENETGVHTIERALWQ